MHIQFTQEQLALRKKVKSYMEQLMTPALCEESKDPEFFEGGGPEYFKALRQLGKDGWISLGWPKELGGQGATALDQYIFVEEVMRAGFQYPFLTTDAVGPVLASHARNDIQRSLVQQILQGEIVVAIGYSEPSAGTDLASLKTKAVRDGDHWLINGQKIWTSLGDFSEYIWLAVRTDPDPDKRHKGITMFLVPTASEGFSITPIKTLGVRTNATYYENIRLSDEYRVGEVNQGWKLITGQLNRERLALVNHGPIELLYDDVRHWAAQTRHANGKTLIDLPWVRSNLAKVKIGLEALKLICLRQAWAMSQDTLQMADASAAKVYGTEFFVEAYRLLMEIMGQAGTLQEGSPGAVLQGRLEHRYRCGSILTFGGGTNEIQKEIIAGAGLWMPRSR